jgi:archaellum component FlaF (FlaF/FlaG flagellin family)
MKTSCLAIVLLSSIVAGAQPALTATQTALPPPTAYSVVDSGANHRVWERSTYEKAPDGTVVSKKHRFIELATGLNYLQNGQWTESKEEIDVLPQGGAVATKGQHQVYFPGDIYQGVIQMVTPDGEQLQSRPLGISYDDGTNIVMIAELTNSVGVLVSSNQIVYPNAFTDFRADLVCTYRKSGFECDLVFRDQPPAPEQFGLDSKNTKLQLLTEFFNTPEPVQTTAAPSRRDGLQDTTLKFGATTMGRGKAFMVGGTPQATNDVRVYKSWIHLRGRTFLVEEVPYPRIQPSLESLPAAAMGSLPADSVLHRVSAMRLLPPSRLVQKGGTNTVQLARTDAVSKRGVVLDYVTLNSDQTDYTFQADTTYYITGQFAIAGTTTFEGGAVIKYDQSGSAEMDTETVNCQSASYRPAIFTAKDDDTVGEPLPGSSGSPSGYYAYIALYVDAEANETLSHLRFSYCYFDINLWSSTSSPVTVTARDIQILNAAQGFYTESAYGNITLYLYNGLIANLSSGCFGGDYWGGGAANLTAVNCYFAGDGSANCQGFTVSNSILAEIPAHLDDNIGVSGGFNVFYESVSNASYCTGGGVAFNPCYIETSWPFQTVGAGGYYLATNSPYRDLGTTNLDAGLLADLQNMTTYPPIVYSNTTISAATTFSPQAQRDDNPAVDLGYHYDPLDYVFGGTEVQSNITFTAGTAVGWFDSSAGYYGIIVEEDATAAFNGIVTAPCWLARYDAVQEGGNGNWVNTSYLAGVIAQNSNANYTPDAPQLLMQFTKCSSRPFNDEIFRDYTGYFVVQARNCEFYGSSGGYDLSQTFTNCLFFRSSLGDTADGSPSFTMQNCTLTGGGSLSALWLQHWSGTTWPVVIRDCSFDGIDIYADSSGLTCDYNSFLTNDDRLPISGAHDLILTSSYNWESSWFGNYYLPTNSPLINAGDVTADQVGLYHFTTQTNQVPETNSIVDIGYHYVATDTNGVPLDTNGDGIPDYLEDVNGNGLVDSGEIGWNIVGDLGLQVLITQPQNGSTIP